MKKILFLFVAISFFSASVLKASVSSTNFVVTNSLTNGAFYINPSTGGQVGYGYTLARGFTSGTTTLEDGSCIVTLVMNVSGVYQNISSPLSIADADWLGEDYYLKTNASATIPAQATYGPVYLKVQKGTSITYSSMSYGVTTFSSGLAPGLQQYVTGSGVYTNDANKTKFYPSTTVPVLTLGQAISSPNGTYVLNFQPDGNIVLYKNGTTALWSTNTAGKGATSLFFQTDGNLVAYKSGTTVWASNRYNNVANLGTNYFYALQNDGNIIFYYTYASATGVTMFYSLGSTGTAGGVVSSHSGVIN